MLKQRILVALILAPLVVAGIVWLPVRELALMLAVFLLLGAWEWGRMAALESLGRGLLTVALAVVMAALWWWRGAVWIVPGLLVVAGLWWLLVAGWLVWHRSSPGAGPTWPRWMKILAAFFTLIPPWVALVWLQADAGYGAAMVLFVLCLVWIADIAAFVAGRQWGRHKLAAGISPGKTLEGVAGALVAVAAFSVVVGLAMGLPGAELQALLGIALLTGVFSVVGDLLESLLKRQAGIKDSGTLFPGHGGVLDRIDSVTAAAPVFVLLLWWAAMPA